MRPDGTWPAPGDSDFDPTDMANPNYDPSLDWSRTGTSGGVPSDGFGTGTTYTEPTGSSPSYAPGGSTGTVTKTGSDTTGFTPSGNPVLIAGRYWQPGYDSSGNLTQVPWIDPATGEQGVSKTGSTSTGTREAGYGFNQGSAVVYGTAPNGDAIYFDPTTQEYAVGSNSTGWQYANSPAALDSILNVLKTLNPTAPKTTTKSLTDLRQDQTGQWWGFNGSTWQQISGGPPPAEKTGGGSSGGSSGGYSVANRTAPSTYGGGSADNSAALAAARAAAARVSGSALPAAASGYSNVQQDAQGQWWGFDGTNWVKIPGGPAAPGLTPADMLQMQLETMREGAASSQQAAQLAFDREQLAQQAAQQRQADLITAAKDYSTAVSTPDLAALPAFLAAGGGNIFNGLAAMPNGMLTPNAIQAGALALQNARNLGATGDVSNPFISGQTGSTIIGSGGGSPAPSAGGTAGSTPTATGGGLVAAPPATAASGGSNTTMPLPVSGTNTALPLVAQPIDPNSLSAGAPASAGAVAPAIAQAAGATAAPGTTSSTPPASPTTLPPLPGTGLDANGNWTTPIPLTQQYPWQQAANAMGVGPGTVQNGVWGPGDIPHDANGQMTVGPGDTWMDTIGNWHTVDSIGNVVDVPVHGDMGNGTPFAPTPRQQATPLNPFSAVTNLSLGRRTSAMPDYASYPGGTTWQDQLGIGSSGISSMTALRPPSATGGLWADPSWNASFDWNGPQYNHPFDPHPWVIGGGEHLFGPNGDYASLPRSSDTWSPGPGMPTTTKPTLFTPPSGFGALSGGRASFPNSRDPSGNQSEPWNPGDFGTKYYEPGVYDPFSSLPGGAWQPGISDARYGLGKTGTSYGGPAWNSLNRGGPGPTGSGTSYGGPAYNTLTPGGPGSTPVQQQPNTQMEQNIEMPGFAGGGAIPGIGIVGDPKPGQSGPNIELVIAPKGATVLNRDEVAQNPFLERLAGPSMDQAAGIPHFDNGGNIIDFMRGPDQQGKPMWTMDMGNFMAKGGSISPVHRSFSAFPGQHARPHLPAEPKFPSGPTAPSIHVRTGAAPHIPGAPHIGKATAPHLTVAHQVHLPKVHAPKNRTLKLSGGGRHRSSSGGRTTSFNPNSVASALGVSGLPQNYVPTPGQDSMGPIGPDMGGGSDMGGTAGFGGTAGVGVSAPMSPAQIAAMTTAGGAGFIPQPLAPGAANPFTGPQLASAMAQPITGGAQPQQPTPMWEQDAGNFMANGGRIRPYAGGGGIPRYDTGGTLSATQNWPTSSPTSGTGTTSTTNTGGQNTITDPTAQPISATGSFGAPPSTSGSSTGTTNPWNTTQPAAPSGNGSFAPPLRRRAGPTRPFRCRLPARTPRCRCRP